MKNKTSNEGGVSPNFGSLWGSVYGCGLDVLITTPKEIFNNLSAVGWWGVRIRGGGGVGGTLKPFIHMKAWVIFWVQNFEF